MAVSGQQSVQNQTSDDSLSHSLTSKTPFLDLKLYLVIGICIACLITASLTIFLCLRSKRNSKRRRMRVKHSSGLLPPVSKQIIEAKESDLAEKSKMEEYEREGKEEEAIVIAELGKEIGTEIVGKKRSSESHVSGGSRSDTSSSAVSAVTSTSDGMSIGWGRWYGLSELEMATRGFADENVIGEGGYGVVFRAVLTDGSVVAVKNLLNNKGQAEKEFKVEVEAIGKVRHKNLVGLLGYCAEGARRLLVYEYMDNGNLEQWLHGDVGPVSPLTWDIRMKIVVGTAKGLAYLHEGLEPKVVHRDVKSSNILLDRKWNPKVSDFGLAKLLEPEKSHVTTRVMGTFGYVSPEYASTGMLNEWSDVFSFGVLLMEIVTGRNPVDYSRPPGEMNLVDWFKGMVASRRGEEVVDPLIQVQPAPRALKRVLLVCLRCIDLDVKKRPKMGQIVHMLEADEFPFRAEPRTTKETTPLNSQAAVLHIVPHASNEVVDGDAQRSKWR
ncbi:Receptor-like serine/threonine-protein kinase [Actinidia chinensis var. chinensis]|uniref:non-specific serine/threonine protein kinase n=1 Tax=Actinidia chinensis var. chinensis TaxID=1590841 RepID=A0A2R6RBZ7_ACTCC|nr:Receptor-like serine/threonine-protein kinase [Actinidia chinensis var. chinensis]